MKKIIKLLGLQLILLLAGAFVSAVIYEVFYKPLKTSSEEIVICHRPDRCSEHDSVFSLYK